MRLVIEEIWNGVGTHFKFSVDISFSSGVDNAVVQKRLDDDGNNNDNRAFFISCVLCAIVKYIFFTFFSPVFVIFCFSQRMYRTPCEPFFVHDANTK